MEGLFLLLAVALVLLAYVVARLRRRGSVSGADADRIRKHWAAARSASDPSMRVLEGEKTLASLLKALGYEGSVAEQLKQAGPRLPDVESIWQAHKMRNRLAHEPGFAPSAQEAERAIRAIGRAVDRFLPK